MFVSKEVNTSMKVSVDEISLEEFESAKESSLVGKKQQVLNVLNEKGVAMSKKGLMTAIGTEYLHNELYQMVQKGQLVRKRIGKTFYYRPVKTRLSKPN